MIKPECAKCHTELKEYGGILFSPPIDNGVSVSTVIKTHLCSECYHIVFEFATDMKGESSP